MYVTRVEVRNVRSFLGHRMGRTLIRMPREGGPGWHVFAGPNGSGKSTLLRALALAVAGPDHAPTLMSSFAGWDRDGKHDALAMVELARDEEDRFEGADPVPEGPLEIGLAWHPQEEGEPTQLEKGKNKKLGRRGPWSRNPRGWLVVGYGPFRRLDGATEDARRVMTGPYHQRRLVSLFREDASLTEAVSWVKGLQFRKLEKRKGAKDLLDKALALLNDRLLPDGAQVARVGSDGVWVTSQGGESEVELRDLSDGYRMVLALVVDLLRQMQDAHGEVKLHATGGAVRVHNPAVVLIDEVDAHLHVSWQQRIGFWLTERFPRVQFLVTTHSPFICQAAAQGGLFRMPRPGELRGVEAVDDDTYYKVVNGTVDDAVLSSLFGMERTRSEPAEKLTDEWSKLRVTMSERLLTAAERERFNQLTRELPVPFDPPETAE
jgi:hypothetical protein